MQKRFIALGALMLALLPGRIMAQAETPGATTTPATTPVGTAVTTPQAASTVPATSTVPVTILADLDPNSATGIRTEGLIADSMGRIYTSDTASRRLYRLTPDSPQVTVLGTLPASATGMAFDSAGNLYLASSGNILKIGADKLQGNQIQESDVQTFATGVTGSNGLIFDAQDRLYVSGGATGNIYVVATNGMTSTFATGFRSEREAQQISTNGLGFGPDGRLYSSNTGTGAIDRVTVNADGTAGPVERFVTNPLLLGADGIAFAANGDLYVAANERNAIVRVTPAGQVSDVASNGNTGPLEFPASLAFSGSSLYASNFDIERGANSPAAPGIGASVAQLAVGVPGIPRPVAGGAAPPAQNTVTPVIGDAVSATAPPQTMPTSTVEPIDGPPIATPTTEAVIPVGMPQTGGPDSLLWLLLTAMSGLLLMLGALARRGRSYARMRK
ncbi:MAG: SMP-30/gluconolactonase/LRE family protein [Chloroflexota bacterium]|nr:SMP-30/gluconolactonase/LRE family protein [Chloroflexota bacterium]